MIEKLNRLKKRLAQVKAGPAAIAIKAAGLGEALTDIEGLIEQLVTDTIDQGNRLTMLESVVDELVVEQGEGVTS
jgi:hypothetical protein